VDTTPVHKRGYFQHIIFANYIPFTAHYDSMLVKCTCHGSTYEIVRRKMLRALVEFRIRGVKTNIPFLASLLTHPTFIDGNCWTTFIDDTPELFDLVGSQNRAQKLLAYLGDVAVNGSSIKGQIGEPKFKGDIILPELFDEAGKKIDTSEPCQKGWRNIIVEEGPEAFAKAVRANKGCLLMDTTWRDAHQSLLATRVRTVDLLNIAKETSHAYSNLYSLECWGGATFDVAMRFLYEDPWDRLRKMRKLVPNIPFQMLLRGANGVAYSSLPDNAIYHFCEQAKKHGVDVFRVFDALNDINQLEVGIKAVHQAGGVVEGTVCYSGDMLVRFFLLSYSPQLGSIYFRSCLFLEPVLVYEEGSKRYYSFLAVTELRTSCSPRLLGLQTLLDYHQHYTFTNSLFRTHLKSITWNTTWSWLESLSISKSMFWASRIWLELLSQGLLRS
jgi:pyruvate carboxylase